MVLACTWILVVRRSISSSEIRASGNSLDGGFLSMFGC